MSWYYNTTIKIATQHVLLRTSPTTEPVIWCVYVMITRRDSMRVVVCVWSVIAGIGHHSKYSIVSAADDFPPCTAQSAKNIYYAQHK